MIINGDCLEVMRTYPDNHFSGIVTDPPYGLHFMGKEWDKFKRSNFDEDGNHKYLEEHERGVRKIATGNSHAGTYDESRNDEFEDFMYRFGVESLRICKPGSFILMCGAPRRFHRQVCGLEDAGWQIRDCLMWLHGQGFPKSHNHYGLPGYGTALKPAWEPIIMAMKPCEGTFAQNAEKYGQAGINIEATRIFSTDPDSIPSPLTSCTFSFSSLEKARDFLYDISSALRSCNTADIIHWRNVRDQNGKKISDEQCERILTRLFPNGVWYAPSWKAIPDFQSDCPIYRRLCDELIPNVRVASLFSAPSLGDALYDIVEALFEPSNNHLRGTVRLSIEDVKALVYALLTPLLNPALYSSPTNKSTGRWPSNLLLDEEAAAMLDEQSGTLKSGKLKPYNSKSVGYEGGWGSHREVNSESNSGGASRFFYVAKASTAERNIGCGDNKNTHPTVKPISLMQYLITLIAPPKDAIILDPFMGSGTTLLACQNLGIRCVGIEMSADYCEIAKARLSA